VLLALYSFVNGFIIKTTSGASQDITDYGVGKYKI
jgi:hypothetical protein